MHSCVITGGVFHAVQWQKFAFRNLSFHVSSSNRGMMVSSVCMQSKACNCHPLLHAKHATVTLSLQRIGTGNMHYLVRRIEDRHVWSTLSCQRFRCACCFFVPMSISGDARSSVTVRLHGAYLPTSDHEVLNMIIRFACHFPQPGESQPR